MKMKRLYVLPLLTFILASCSVARIDHLPQRTPAPRNLVVFFDGTNNEETSHTNVAKLYNLVTLQQNPNISTTYIKGVGTGLRVIGMTTGWGIGHDVRDAYYYLSKNYLEGDEIFIFGFSRGAFSARILSAMLYVSGLPDINQIIPSKREQFIKDVYSAYKHKFKDLYSIHHAITDSLCERRNKVAKVHEKYGIKEMEIVACDEEGRSQTKYPRPVYVKFMGIWDTVEALGFQDLEENIGEPNPRYADQLCNVQYVAHALSIDDNRARVFTPLLLSQKHIKDETCDMPIKFCTTTLNEVWFSGAHSDVGGGNGTDISGVSLNWMLDMLDEAETNLIPKGAAVYDNYLAKTNEGDTGFAGLFYKKMNRSLDKYIDKEGDYIKFIDKNNDDAANGNLHFVSMYDSKKEGEPGTLSRALKIHQSVLDRLCVVPPQSFESDWYKKKPFIGCIECDGNKGKINERCNELIKAVSNSRYKTNCQNIVYDACDHDACWGARNKPYYKIKSCNYENSSTTSYAPERVNVRKLYKIGDKTTTTFYADRNKDHTGILLKKGMKYQVSIQKDDIEGWKDCIYSASVDDGRPIFSSGKPFSLKVLDALVYPIAHSQKTGYMGLIGQVRGKNYPIGELGIDGGTFVPQNNGELVLLVNEPKFMSKVYKNNHGRVKLKIEVVGVEPAFYNN